MMFLGPKAASPPKNTFGLVETKVVEFRRSSFDVQHRLTKDGALAVEGFETRVWVGRAEGEPETIKAKPVPREVVERLSGG